ncbi:MAG: PDZ domain-containing protein [Acidobacteriota bacterium]|nr:MAG: PDZ domain-containing protein [Acidobacteriota bacterium]
MRIVAALLLASSPVLAQDGISYRLTFPAAANHYVDVEATFPAGDEPIEVMMAVWTPGSYLVREYERHIEGLEASTTAGESLEVVKTRKNRWRIEAVAAGEDAVRVRYRLYAREMTVRTNWVEADFAILNGAPTFLTLVDTDAGLDRPHDVKLELPDGWQGTWTAMPEHPDGGANHYRAQDFDMLVDSPIYAGSPTVHQFEVGGKMHYLVNHGEGDVWDGERSAADVRAIVEEALAFWGELPYERYVFLNMLVESGGGLEHKDSTLMMTSRWRARVPEQYRRWLGLVSHEYFHAWNVKRFRPKALGPFDYENEVYTKSLWVAEGVTSYFDNLLLKRSGLYTQKQYLKGLSNQIKSLQTTPGRQVRPLEEASYDSWIKQYRRDENSPNSTISYYTKGAIVAFLLDAEIRRATDGAKSMDDMMRMGFDLYSGETGYTPLEFRALASEIAGKDLSAWFEKALETTEELDYRAALEWYGLQFKDPDAKKKDEDDENEDAPTPGWLGAETRISAGRLIVSRIKRGTPAYEHGVNVGDEILAIDDYRVEAGDLPDRLKQYAPGDRVELLIARRDRLHRLLIELAEEPKDQWQLEITKDATARQRKHLEAWLSR